MAVNPGLRLVVDKALTANMAKDTIERAIKRGIGEGDDTVYEEIRYEGCGPGGTAMLAADFNPTEAEVTYKADNTTQVEFEDADKILKLIDMLEDLDDVSDVYTNADFSDDVMAQLNEA